MTFDLNEFELRQEHIYTFLFYSSQRMQVMRGNAFLCFCVLEFFYINALISDIRSQTEVLVLQQQNGKEKANLSEWHAFATRFQVLQISIHIDMPYKNNHPSYP